MQPSVLILFAHPALEKSRVNRILVDRVQDLPGVTFHDLYQQYPDFDIDVAREQQLLTAHDKVVLQFPFYWYSTPALVKEWEDLVLEHGWAYGHDGKALRGKSLTAAISTGGGARTYTRSGSNRYEMKEFLIPLERTAVLCGMRWLQPFVIHGTHALDDAAIAAQAEAYRQFIADLRDGNGERP